MTSIENRIERLGAFDFPETYEISGNTLTHTGFRWVGSEGKSQTHALRLTDEMAERFCHLIEMAERENTTRAWDALADAFQSAADR